MAHTPAQPAAAVAARARFQPYVPASQSPAEFTAKAIVLGALFGLIFGASTVYLGLRAGLTVSASIPIAVLAISVLKRLGGSTILENNIVQTIGSAGESVAAGVVFTVPALLFFGERGQGFFNYFQITMLAFAGGILGVLMMVPLRRALIVKEHGVLPYPEGTACADVLVAGERGGALAKTVFMGLGVGALWKACPGSSRSSRPRSAGRSAATSIFPNATLNVDISPEYMGVGYVIGPRIAGVMFAGGVLSWLVLLPLLQHHGQLPDGAVSARAGERAAHRSDVAGPALERLHPLHRRRRGARGRADHAGPHDPDDRVVVPRQHEGLLAPRARRRRPDADRARHADDGRARRHGAAGAVPGAGAAGCRRRATSSPRSWSSSSASSSSPSRRASSA